MRYQREGSVYKKKDSWQYILYLKILFCYWQEDSQSSGDPNNAVVFMVSSRPQIPKSSCSFTKKMVTVPRTVNIRYFYVHIFFILSICLRSSLVHFKNGPEYLKREEQSGIYLFYKINFIYFVSNSFLVLLM